MAKKDKKALAKKHAKQKLEIALETQQNREFLAIRNQFIDKFTLCDLTCKVILEGYKKQQKQNNQDFRLVLDMRTIPYAFAWAGYEVDRNVLSRIFGGSKSFKKQGTKSAKKLRDGIVHAMNVDDIQELVERQNELFSVMNTYLSLFKLPNEIANQSTENVEVETKIA